MKLGLIAAAALAALVGCSSEASAPGAPGGQTPPGPSAPTPVAAATETLTVESDLGPVEGTLEVPDSPEAVPLAIIVSGSGAQDRDGNRADGSGPANLKLLADGLRGSGIATLRFDDLGVGKNADALPKNVEDLTYGMEIDVVLRWVDLLKADARFRRIVIAGHSQGSLTGILVGQQRDVAVVSLEGAGRPLRQLILEQMKPQVSSKILGELDGALAKLEAGELAGPLDPPLNAILPEDVQPYMISWAKYDPKVEIGKTKSNILLIQGGTDTQVFLKDAELLKAGKAEAELVVIDDMCHPLKQTTETEAKKQSKQYQDPSLPLHDELVPAIATFIKKL